MLKVGFTAICPKKVSLVCQFVDVHVPGSVFLLSFEVLECIFYKNEDTDDVILAGMEGNEVADKNYIFFNMADKMCLLRNLRQNLLLYTL